MNDHEARRFADLVRREMAHCRIPLMAGADVAPYSVVGKIGDFDFAHSNRGYWIVKGLVPLATAQVLYADPLGRDAVRVDGHCMCPAPQDPWLTYRDDQGREVLMIKDRDEIEAMCDKVPSFAATWAKKRDRFIYSTSRHLFHAFVELYHIDSEAGLRLFVDTISALPTRPAGDGVQQ